MYIPSNCTSLLYEKNIYNKTRKKLLKKKNTNKI